MTFSNLLQQGQATLPGSAWSSDEFLICRMEPDNRKRSILVICNGNTCRSPMTAAILKQMRPAWIVEDAGVQPDRSNGYAERVMLERGIMLKSRPGRSWKIFAGRSFDAVLVLSQKAAEMLSREAPDWTLFHMTIPDPAAVAEKGVEEETLQAYRNTADQIEAGLTSWIAAFEEAGKDA